MKLRLSIFFFITLFKISFTISNSMTFSLEQGVTSIDLEIGELENCYIGLAWNGEKEFSASLNEISYAVTTVSDKYKLYYLDSLDSLSIRLTVDVAEAGSLDVFVSKSPFIPLITIENELSVNFTISTNDILYFAIIPAENQINNSFLVSVKSCDKGSFEPSYSFTADLYNLTDSKILNQFFGGKYYRYFEASFFELTPFFTIQHSSISILTITWIGQYKKRSSSTMLTRIKSKEISTHFFLNLDFVQDQTVVLTWNTPDKNIYSDSGEMEFSYTILYQKTLQTSADNLIYASFCSNSILTENSFSDSATFLDENEEQIVEEEEEAKNEEEETEEEKSIKQELTEEEGATEEEEATEEEGTTEEEETTEESETTEEEEEETIEESETTEEEEVLEEEEPIEEDTSEEEEEDSKEFSDNSNNQIVESYGEDIIWLSDDRGVNLKIDYNTEYLVLISIKVSNYAGKKSVTPIQFTNAIIPLYVPKITTNDFSATNKNPIILFTISLGCEIILSIIFILILKIKNKKQSKSPKKINAGATNPKTNPLDYSVPRVEKETGLEDINTLKQGIAH